MFDPDMDEYRFGCGIFACPYYVGKSETSMRSRLLSKEHPARKFWRHGDTTCALWIPECSTIDDFERALILACGSSINRTSGRPRRYVHWEEPVLVDIKRRRDVLDTPGVYAVISGKWKEQFSMHAAEDVHWQMNRCRLIDRGMQRV